MRKWLSILMAMVLAVMPMVVMAETAASEDEMKAAYQAAQKLYDSGNVEQSLIELTALADQGYADAMKSLGWIYVNGEFEGAPDSKKGLEWYLKAAKADSGDAMYALGYYYGQGTFSDGVPDYASALQWWLKGAEAGNSYCMFSIGRYYMHDAEITDPEEAAAWLEKSFEAGYVPAGYNLAAHYYYGDIPSDGDTKLKARDWYLKTAKAGHLDSGKKLTEFYRNKETAEDGTLLVTAPEMLAFLEEQYDAGTEETYYLEALNWLLAGQDETIEADYQKAYEVAQKGAALGDNVSMYQLASLYRKEVIELEDGTSALEKSLEWDMKAAEAGNRDAGQRIIELYKEKTTLEDGTLLLPAPKLLEFLEGRYAAGTEDTYLLDWLGWLLSGNDEAVEADYQRAYEVYRRGADLGSSYAMYQIGFLHRDGVLADGTPDLAKAVEWLIKAANSNYPGAAREVVSCYTEKKTAEDGTLLLPAAELLEFLEGRYAAGTEDTYLLDWLGWLLAGNDETVEADYLRAYEVYKASADLGSNYAMYQISTMYRDGKMGKVDEIAAQAWYDKAIEAGYTEDTQLEDEE